MKENKIYWYYGIIIILITLCFSLHLQKDKIKLKNISKESVVVIDSVFNKIEISKLNYSNISLFFWFSSKCCHQCVSKEIKNINSIELDIKLLYAFRPIRNWEKERKYIIKENNITQDIFCLYNIYSFLQEDSVPYYFIYNKENNEISNVFFPDRNNPKKTLEYFKNMKKKYGLISI